MKLVIPLFQSEFDAQQLLVNRFGKIPPIGDFGYFWWLLWLKNPIFRHDFEIGHLVGILKRNWAEYSGSAWEIPNWEFPGKFGF